MQGSLFIGGIPCYSIKGVSGMYPLRIKFGFLRRNPNLMRRELEFDGREIPIVKVILWLSIGANTY